MPPPRTGFTFDDGSLLDEETLRRLGYGDPVLGRDGLMVDLSGIEGLDAGAVAPPPAARRAPLSDPGTPVLGDASTFTFDDGSSMVLPPGMVVTPRGVERADAAAERAAEYRAFIGRGITAEPSTPSVARDPGTATSETVTGPITARVETPARAGGGDAAEMLRREAGAARRSPGGIPTPPREPADGIVASPVEPIPRGPDGAPLVATRALTPEDLAIERPPAVLVPGFSGIREGVGSHAGALAERDAGIAAGAEARSAESDAVLNEAARREARDVSAEDALIDTDRRDSEETRRETRYALGEPEPVGRPYDLTNAAGVGDALGRVGHDISTAAREFFGIEDPTPEEDAAMMALLGESTPAGGDATGAGVPEAVASAAGSLPTDIAGAPASGRRGGGGRRSIRAPVDLPAPPPPPAQREGAPYDPLNRALNRNDRSTDLAVIGSDIERRGYEDTRAAIRGAERARIENEDTRRAAMHTSRERYRTAMERATAMTLDPEGWYHDRGAIGTIGAVIATAMGSFGSALTGGTNEALGIINASIERDLLAQQNAIDQGHARATGEANLMDMLGAEFQTRDAAVAAARAAMLEDVANRVSAEAAALGTEEARVAGEAMHDDLINQANAQALESARAEADYEIDLALRAAQAREAMADAQRAERRAASGGAGGPSYGAPSHEDLTTINMLHDTNPDVPLTALYELYGIDPALAGGATRVAEASTAESSAAAAQLSTALDRIAALTGPEANATTGAPAGDIPGMTDIPIVGRALGALPDEVLEVFSPTGARLRQELNNAVDAFARTRSGAAIPDPEFDRLRRTILGTGTEAGLRNGVVILHAAIDASERRERDGTSASFSAADYASGAGRGGVD